MPGRKGYVAAAVLFVLGLTAAGAFLFLRLPDLGEGIQQVVVPGATELRLEEPGGYTIYHETGVTVDGRYYASDEVAGLAVSITDPGGAPIEVRGAGTTTSYEFGGRKGRSVLGVSHGFGQGLAITIGGTLALAFGSASVALGLAIVTFVRRHRARRGQVAVAPPR